MQNRKFSPYIGFGILATLLLMLGTFVGGVILAPYVNEDVQAAGLTQSNDAVQQSADGTDVITAYEQTLIDVYQETLPSVVNIRVIQKIEHQTGNNRSDFEFSPFDRNPFEEGPMPEAPDEFYNRGQGSGFVWDNEGHIVTNYHVIAEATDVEVIFADGTTLKAEVLGSDPDADLAVIKIDLPANDLQPVTLSDSDNLQVGQLAIAIGNPFGQDFTMTSGIVSAVERMIRSGNGPFSIPEVIQTDAPINPGNSGGPLLNRQGEVIGINTQIISRGGANSGIGFAVPINTARQIIPTLIKGETYQYAWLGISGITLASEVVDFMQLPADTKGALVINVAQDGPADEAGLKGSDKMLEVAGMEYSLGGDVITAISGQTIEDMEGLITYLAEETRPGDEVALDVIRPDGQQETVEVTLGIRPSGDSIN
jgi:2-alkenal reductase